MKTLLIFFVIFKVLKVLAGRLQLMLSLFFQIDQNTHHELDGVMQAQRFVKIQVEPTSEDILFFVC